LQNYLSLQINAIGKLHNLSSFRVPSPGLDTKYLKVNSYWTVICCSLLSLPCAVLLLLLLFKGVNYEEWRYPWCCLLLQFNRPS
jgi:hypothetical protein